MGRFDLHADAEFEANATDREGSATNIHRNKEAGALPAFPPGGQLGEQFAAGFIGVIRFRSRIEPKCLIDSPIDH
ncbi:hypothetical protein ACQ4WX_50070 [Streptomyces lasalocidi]